MIFRFDRVSYCYPDGTNALKSISLELGKGKKIALVGTNGSGKTTLLLQMNGILKPTSGKLYFEGRCIEYGQAFLTELRKRVGYVFQDPNDQLFAATVRQDVAFGPLNMGLSLDEVKGRVNEALETVEMIDYANKPPHFLSMGQKKRVAIAGVLAMRPDIIIMDEPTSELDGKMVDQIMGLLSKLNSEGKTVIISTHDVDLALEWADQALVLRSGTLLAQGPPMEIFDNEDTLARSGLKIPLRLELFNHLKNHADSLERPFNLDDLITWLLPRNNDPTTGNLMYRKTLLDAKQSWNP
jgi:cobalt/nickel transport system ATP-binding protein